MAISAVEAGYKVALLSKISVHKDLIEGYGIEVISWSLKRKSMNVISEIKAYKEVTSAIDYFRPNIVHSVALKPMLYNALQFRRKFAYSNVYALGGLGFIFSSEKFKGWKLRFGWMPPHPATFIKKAVYEKIGNYAVDYKISADYELFVRMLMVHNLAYSRIDKVLVRMRAGGVSTSGIKSILLLNSEIVKACKRNGIYTNLFFLIWKIPFKILEVFRRPSNSKR